MSILVEQQDETINVIEAQAEAADKDLETGCVHTPSSFRIVIQWGHAVSNTPKRQWTLRAQHARSDGYASSSA